MKMTKEMRDNIVTVLYEKCSTGEISRVQREKLIQKANAMFEVEVSESVDTIETNPVEELSPKEKYNKFKTVVYEKCANGEITESTREELLEKARDKFFTISE